MYILACGYVNSCYDLHCSLSVVTLMLVVDITLVEPAADTGTSGGSSNGVGIAVGVIVSILVCLTVFLVVTVISLR